MVLDDVWYSYPGQRGWALRGVSVSFREGELVVLLGPNGSGKTTLLKVAGLLLKPQKGRVIVEGRDYWSQPEEARQAIKKKVVYVHERPIMLKGSVERNIAYGLFLRGYREEEALEKARRLLEELGGEKLAGKDARSLSFGEAQLVSIARALAVSPHILLLDDPLSGLDLERQELLLGFLESYKENGACIVMATHDMQASRRADKVFRINMGKVLMEARS
ncbi:MAG: energy-coupling factor ABC transporter ATP-binding protein [Desulfurococcales archaeon]|nr:energy-coupling factor ABC transporter ATP-binding protein [Desulfurococcales archaeon]